MKQDILELYKRCLNANFASESFTMASSDLVECIDDSSLEFINNLLLRKTKYHELSEYLVQENHEDLADNIYHTPKHIACVMIFSNILMRHSMYNFNKDQYEEMAVAALSHDLLHSGVNPMENSFKLEFAAFLKLNNAMKNYGLYDPEKASLARTLIFSTEASVRRYLKEAKAALKLPLNEQSGIMRFLQLNTKNYRMAQILADSDMFCSIGVNVATTLKQTELVMDELLYKTKTKIDLETLTYNYFSKVVPFGFCSEVGSRREHVLSDIKKELFICKNKPYKIGEC